MFCLLQCLVMLHPIRHATLLRRTSPINVEECYGRHKVFSLCKICVLLDVEKFSDDAKKKEFPGYADASTVALVLSLLKQNLYGYSP